MIGVFSVAGGRGGGGERDGLFSLWRVITGPVNALHRSLARLSFHSCYRVSVRCSSCPDKRCLKFSVFAAIFNCVSNKWYITVCMVSL